MGIDDERCAPELDAGVFRLAAGKHLVPDAVDRHDIAAIGDRVASLDGLPRRLLALAILGLLRRQPADRGGIDKDFRALHCGEPGGFGIPLIPAHQHADAADLGVPDAKAEIARREIEFLVVLRVIRNVHLPVLAEILAGGIDHGGGVVIQAAGALLEQRRDDHDAEFAGDVAEPRRRRSRDRFRELEEVVIFALAEVVPVGQLLEAHQPRAAPRRLANAGNGVLEVGSRVGANLLLDQTDSNDARRIHGVTKIVAVRAQSPEPEVTLEPRAGPGRLLLNAAFLALVLTAPMSAQRLDWRTSAVLYADNTEFFTPYRVGETILGGQVTTWLAARTGPRTELRVGLFADR